jgi:hypothetical protein
MKIDECPSRECFASRHAPTFLHAARDSVAFEASPCHPIVSRHLGLIAVLCDSSPTSVSSSLHHWLTVVMLSPHIRSKCVYVYMYKRPCCVHNGRCALSHNFHPARSKRSDTSEVCYCFRHPLVAGRRR